MIRSVNNRRPKIIFSDTPNNWRTIIKDDIIKIWVYTIFNKKTFSSEIITPVLTVNKVSDYEYEVTADTKGFHKIQIAVSNQDKSKSIISNSLVLIVL